MCTFACAKFGFWLLLFHFTHVNHVLEPKKSGELAGATALTFLCFPSWNDRLDLTQRP